MEMIHPRIVRITVQRNNAFPTVQLIARSSANALYGTAVDGDRVFSGV